MESKSKSSLRPDTPLPVQPDSSKLQGKQRSPLTSELLIASRRGHASEVKRLLAEGGGSLAQTVLDKVSMIATTLLHQMHCMPTIS